MTSSTAASQRERDAQTRARGRAEQAQIVSGLHAALEGDEQLLGFARGRIAGGWRGKLSVGPEAFFAPFVNVALTDRRLLVQHVHPENGRPSEILAHSFLLQQIASLNFANVETFGTEAAGRLVIHLKNEQHIRIRIRGELNVISTRSLVEVFTSLTGSTRSAAVHPTVSLCPHCGNALYQPSRFCPYCGKLRSEAPAEQRELGTEGGTP